MHRSRIPQNWGRHCNQFRKDSGDAKNDDDDYGDDDADQLRQRETEVGDTNSGKDAVIRQRAAEPKKRHGPKKSEPGVAASERRQRGSAGDERTQSAKQPKRKVACKKFQPE